mgnify:CR=1 FL=1
MSMKRLVILGGGESGTGAALLGKAKGYEVFLSDLNELKDKYRDILTANQIPFEEKKHTEEIILQADLVIKSPGIPDKAPLIRRLREQGTEIISEIEFASRYTQSKIIAITGSNGKTTTTLLTYHLLKSAGWSVGLAGNVGESFARQVLAGEYDYYVLELSSFQLDNMYDFRADVAVLLNITPDHLDRYEYKFENYIRSKFRIIRNQRPDDFFIYYLEDPVIGKELPVQSPAATLLPVSLKGNTEAAASLQNDGLTFRIDELAGKVIPLEVLPIKGPHNYLNAMSAVLAAAKAGLSFESIVAGLATFKNASHRLEKVAVIDGVEYINDSKATNVDSVYYALQSFENPIILLLGGVDKGNDYDAIRELVKAKVKGIIALGKDNAKLENYFSPLVPSFFATDRLDEALRKAREWAVANDVVLLSPACASFDLFKNYEDRGDRFKEAVLKLV